MGFDERWTFRDCPHCGVRDAQFGVLGQAGIQAQRPGGHPAHWTVLACPRCAGVVAIEHSGAQSVPTIRRVIPTEDESSVGIRHMPPGIRQTYGDAVRVLQAGVPSAAAVLLRRTLEGAAAHHGITERTLVKSIEAMIENGLVTPSFGKVLHHVRLVGNQGAHYTDEELTEEQAQQALRFTAALLRNVFEVPGELAQLEQDEDGSEGSAG